MPKAVHLTKARSAVCYLTILTMHICWHSWNTYSAWNIVSIVLWHIPITSWL